MKKTAVLIIAVLCVFTPASLSGAAEALERLYSAQVRDVSDRAYEAAVTGLLDGASESIVISMYILNPGNGLVGLLVGDLVEALERGVSVTIGLNTKFIPGKEVDVIGDEAFRLLEEKGAKILLYNPAYRVHDKLIIVDSRYVVEGSTNWSVSALKNNFESATIIDSPELAKDKLRRIKRIPLKGENAKTPKKEKVLRPLGYPDAGKTMEFPKALLEQKSYFPRMVTAQDNRAMDTYILLLAESQKQAKKELDVSLEDLAFTLKLPADRTNDAKRRQVIKALRRLKTKYKLIDLAFDHGGDAHIILVPIPGETFTVDGSLVSTEFLLSKTVSGQFVAYMETLLESEGQAPRNLTYPDLTKRFHVSQWGIRSGRKELSYHPGIRETDIRDLTRSNP